MAGFDLERAIVGPQIHRGCYARHASFEDLTKSQRFSLAHAIKAPYHLCRFSASDGEFEIRIFLPIPKEERKLRKKAVVCISGCCDSLWAGVSIQAALEGLSRANELLPVLKIVGIFELSGRKVNFGGIRSEARMQNHLQLQL